MCQSIVCGIFVCFLGLYGGHSHAQIAIGPSGKTLVTDSAHTLLELTSPDDQGRGLLLPRADSASMRKAGTAQLPYGTTIYDSTSHLFYVWVKSSATAAGTNNGTWRPLLYHADKKNSETKIFDLRKEDIEGSNSCNNCMSNNGATNSASSSNQGCTELTLKTPDGYKPFQATANGSSGGISSAFADISYNGLSLTPGRDFEAKVEGDKVKITFKTLSPECWEEFSRFAVMYISK